MREWQTIIILALAQAHLVYLVVDSNLSLKFQAKLKLPKLVKELLSCPVCTGFWVALALSKGNVITTLSIGFLGGLFYEMKKKYLPCKECTNKTNVSEWKVK